MDLSQYRYYLEQKLALCERLLEVTNEMSDIVNLGRWLEIEESMKLRESIIKEINHVDSVYLHKCNLEQAMSTEYRDDILSIRLILEQIQEMDEKLVEIIPFAQENLSKEYNQAKAARKIRTAYEGGQRQQGYYLNKQR
ncbi:MAG: hypothetical protein KAX49_00480 [Halanaerobiales bacterium]|nr:hypothetical protein [Halanaerobiales bacterium]